MCSQRAETSALSLLQPKLSSQSLTLCFAITFADWALQLSSGELGQEIEDDAAIRLRLAAMPAAEHRRAALVQRMSFKRELRAALMMCPLRPFAHLGYRLIGTMANLTAVGELLHPTSYPIMVR